MGAQGAADVGLRALRGHIVTKIGLAAKRYVTLHPGSPDAAYAQYLIGSSYFDQIPDVTRDQGRTETGDAGARRGGAQISEHRICHRVQAQARDRARSTRRQGNGDGALLSEAARLHRGDQPLQGGDHAIPDHAPRRGGADAPDRDLHVARDRQRGADRRRRARAQFSRQPLVQGRLPRWCGAAGWSRRGSGFLDQPGVQERRAGFAPEAPRRECGDERGVQGRRLFVVCACPSRTTGLPFCGTRSRLEPCSPVSRSATSS